ncbi:MAG TPA: hypothetical protein VFY75_04810 [Solirubrobacterales bacterium]|nr:hypothetical protein [Solirubrobacterales bacterium]
MAVSAAYNLALTWHFTFLQDTWDLLINRRHVTVDAYFLPHNEHIAVLQTAIEQALLHLFGMTSARPEFFVLTIGLLVTAWLLFVYVRRRLGPWFALFAAVLILFLGPAWELLLWPFEISLLGSVLFGLATLLSLERGDRRGDVVACVCLILSLGFSSLGIPFAVGALVAILQSPRAQWRSRAFVFVVPVLLFAAWYAGWGHEAESHLTARNVLTSPRFVIESVAVGIGNLFGLGANPISDSTEMAWGALLLVVVAALVGWRQLRRPGFDPGLWPVVAVAATNWFLTAFNQIPGRDPVSSRYQYATAVLIIMLLANLLAKERFGTRSVVIGAIVTVLAVAPNIVVLKDGSDNFELQSELTKADTAALEIARRTVPAEFQLNPEISGTGTLVNVYAGKYLEAVDEFGSPAYTPSELETAPPYATKQTDIILGQALPLSTRTQPGVYDPRGGENCVTITEGEPQEVRIDPGQTRIEVAPGPDASFSLRRFATEEYPVRTAGAPGESTTTLRVPRDEAPQPWYLHVEAEQTARVCR